VLKKHFLLLSTVVLFNIFVKTIISFFSGVCVLVVDIGHFEIAIAQLTIVSAFTFVISKI